jgi:hypothetical protein
MLRLKRPELKLCWRSLPVLLTQPLRHKEEENCLGHSRILAFDLYITSWFVGTDPTLYL